MAGTAARTSRPDRGVCRLASPKRADAKPTGSHGRCAITGTPQQELERKLLRLPGDPMALRGLPLVGRQAIGGAIPGTTPGSDSHLETIDVSGPNGR